MQARRTRAIVSIALRTATGEEKKLLNAELKRVQADLAEEQERIPPEFAHCYYFKSLTVEREHVAALLVKLSDVYLLIL